jgi:hypothetical protein
MRTATEIAPAVNEVELHPYFAQPDVQQADTEHGILTQHGRPSAAHHLLPGRGKDRHSVVDDPTRIAENFDLSFTPSPEEVAAIDARHRGAVEARPRRAAPGEFAMAIPAARGA